MGKKKKTFEYYVTNIGVLLLGIGIVGWLCWTIYIGFWGVAETEKTIKFEVTGITNSENASSLVQIHYECIKYCMSHTSSSQSRRNCFEQCTLLGKEGCDE